MRCSDYVLADAALCQRLASVSEVYPNLKQRCSNVNGFDWCYQQNVHTAQQLFIQHIGFFAEQHLVCWPSARW